ncbi:MAG: hypothetical protein NDI90_20600 [Nitrospira sp. BO4]|jgi:hypothetical protein|nr:hypothetical protein [Nitrospira sp. BO4]
MARDLSIIDTLEDPQLFGGLPVFHDPSTWHAWRVLLKAVYGLPLTAEETVTFQKHTGRSTPPTQRAREAWWVVGRRGGKSLTVALIAVDLACFKDYVAMLAPGERITIMVLAADRRQARVVFNYIKGLLEGVPMLAALIENATQETISLTNRVNIEVHTASFRAVRGYTIAAAICDEIAFWPNDDAAEPDSEVLNALRPAMATVPNALLLCLSSPYARKGELWKAYQRHFGKDHDPVLVWQADTRSMNPLVPQEVIDRAYADDEASASAEYGAQFRRDIEALLPREAIEACVASGRRELPPVPGVRYVAFVDPAGGSGQDSMTMAVAHADGRDVLLDAIREVKPPFSPEATVEEFGVFLRTYRVTRVHGDRYAGEWPREQFSKAGIRYEVCDKSKSDLYRECVPAINSRTVQLLDLPRLVTQFCGLERRVARGGRDSIDHAPNGHDDLANSATGALLLALDSFRRKAEIWMPNLGPDQHEQLPGPEQQQLLNRYGSRMFEKPSGEFTCGTCRAFDAVAADCMFRKFSTHAHLPACETYSPKLS